MAMGRQLLLVVLCCVVYNYCNANEFHNKAGSVSITSYSQAMEQTFAAIKRLLQFFERHHKDMIVDSLFGVRVLQGTLHVVLNGIKNKQIQVAGIANIEKKIKHFYQRASRFADKAVKYARAYDPEYFDTVGFTAKTEWNIIRPFRSTNLNMAWPKSKEHYITPEDEMDDCFGALIGNKKSKIKACTVSKKCWQINTEPYTIGYKLTHQLLYFMLGQKNGCSNIFNIMLKKSQMKGGIDMLYDIRCAAMYPQMLKEEESALKNNTIDNMDLYMEQGVVCGLMGYKEFMTLKRLEYIIHWQHPKGCFGYHGDIKETDDGDDDDDEKDIMEAEDEGFAEKGTMRKLQVTRTLKGGCELHVTGVATGLLGVYLSWIIHQLAKGEEADQADQAKYHRQLPDHGQAPGNQDMTSSIMLFLFIVLVVIIFSQRRLRRRISYFLNCRY